MVETGKEKDTVRKRKRKAENEKNRRERMRCEDCGSRIPAGLCMTAYDIIQGRPRLILQTIVTPFGQLNTCRLPRQVALGKCGPLVNRLYQKTTVHTNIQGAITQHSAMQALL